MVTRAEIAARIVFDTNNSIFHKIEACGCSDFASNWRTSDLFDSIATLSIRPRSPLSFTSQEITFFADSGVAMGQLGDPHLYGKIKEEVEIKRRD